MHNRTPRAAAALVVAALAVLVAVSGAGASRAARNITFCVDTTYPPMESLQGGKAVGADIDIANALVKSFGASATFKTTAFDAIIPSLRAKKCDAIISSLTNTPQRAKQVDFANYITVGMSIMVKTGNPQHITGLGSLSGKTVAVQTSTTEGDVLKQLNKTLAKQGKKSVSIKSFPADTNAAAALLSGKVDAYFADATPVLYYIKRSGGKFEAAGKQIQAAPEGIATRKGDPLGGQFKTAIAKLYANGTMKTLLAKWGLSAFALKK